MVCPIQVGDRNRSQALLEVIEIARPLLGAISAA